MRAASASRIRFGAFPVRRFFSLCFLFSLVSALFIPLVASGNSCFSAVRATFRETPGPVLKFLEAINKRLPHGGRAQAELLDRIRLEKWDEAQAQARLDPGLRNLPQEEVWDRFVEKAMYEVLPNTSKVKRIEDLLWIMRELDPVFEARLSDYHLNVGAIRFKVAAKLSEKALGKRGKRVTRGQKIWDYFQTRILVPRRQNVFHPDEFVEFMTEISAVMFESIHPHPAFLKVWLKAFSRPLKLDHVSRGLLGDFARRFHEDILSYREHFHAELNQTLQNASRFDRSPRAEVVYDLFIHGLAQAFYRRMAAILNLKNPLNKEALLSREIELLSLDLIYYVHPLLNVLFYSGLAVAAGSAASENILGGEYLESVNYPDLDAQEEKEAQLKNKLDQLDARINLLSDEWEEAKEKIGSASSTAEKNSLSRRIKELEEEISRMTSEKESLVRDSTNVNPRKFR
ncbi:MAG: hypothetical protein AB1540_12260 [Bdellovibrionota bacterium]